MQEQAQNSQEGTQHMKIMRVWWCRGYEDNEGVLVQRVRGQ